MWGAFFTIFPTVGRERSVSCILLFILLIDFLASAECLQKRDSLFTLEGEEVMTAALPRWKGYDTEREKEYIPPSTSSCTREKLQSRAVFFDHKIRPFLQGNGSTAWWKEVKFEWGNGRGGDGYKTFHAKISHYENGKYKMSKESSVKKDRGGMFFRRRPHFAQIKKMG